MNDTLVAVPSKREFSLLFPGISAVVASTTPISVGGRFHAAVCGVGLLNCAVGLSRFLQQNSYGRLFLLGTCGAYLHRNLQVGDVVRVESEVVGDMGAQDSAGHFIPWQEISGSDETLAGENPRFLPLALASVRSAVAVSVNCCTGTSYLSLKRSALFNADIESMEGAAAFAVAKAYRVPVHEFRAVSNIATDRDPSQWDIAGAMKALEQQIIPYL